MKSKVMSITLPLHYNNGRLCQDVVSRWLIAKNGRYKFCVICEFLIGQITEFIVGNDVCGQE